MRQHPSLPMPDATDIDELFAQVSNWQRWGEHDELGTINLITPEKRRRAAALVRQGASISLARDVMKIASDSSTPFVHRMLETGQATDAISASDSYATAYHGYTQTHLDALCHIFHQGRMYNGFSREEVSETGAEHLSVLCLKSGIFTRGILVDMPQIHGLPYLPGGRAVGAAELAHWAAVTGAAVEPGDALFLRTGRWRRRAEEGPWNIEQDSAGLHVSAVAWLRQHDVAILGSDLAADVMPSGVPNVRMPVHLLVIAALGAPIIDNCDLEALSLKLREQGRQDFLLTLAPLAVPGGTGSPVNPIATF